jgi:hypothetical protein
MFPLHALLLAALAATALSVQAAEDTRCFELRVYHASPGKLDDLHARFRQHTIPIFDKHAMTGLGYWVPIENTDNLLYYVLAYPSRAAREDSWKAFQADPDWQAAKAASEQNGKLVQKVESTFLQAADFSPRIQPSLAGKERTFELRTYTATPGNLPNLLKRFRDHTCSIFQNHGITNMFYWTLEPDQPEAASTLVYMIAHDSKEAAEASWKAFRADPVWVAAKEASEKEGGGSLTIPNGVKSVFLHPTDYSPTK